MFHPISSFIDSQHSTAIFPLSFALPSKYYIILLTPSLPFSRVWLDNLHMSLQNFISTVLDAVPLPALLRGSSEDKEEKQQLQREVGYHSKKQLDYLLGKYDWLELR